MMRVLRLHVVATMCSFLALGAGAQSRSVQLSELENPIASTRISAFYRLLSQNEQRSLHVDVASSTTRLLTASPTARRQIASALIGLLERENREWKAGRVGSMSQERSDFYGDVIASVASLKDTRSVTALAGAIGTGALATDGLAALGDAALPALDAAQKSEIVMERIGAVYVLSKLASRSNQGLRVSSTLAVRSRLIHGLDDGNPLVRQAAIEGLVPFSDQQVVGLILRIATRDSSDKTRIAANAWLIKKGRRPPL